MARCIRVLGLQDGLMAPPEELPAEEGALDDDDDLPIEDLMDSDDDEDLSLAALLRKRMQQEVRVGPYCSWLPSFSS
jgi:hypothetical protein